MCQVVWFDNQSLGSPSDLAAAGIKWWHIYAFDPFERFDCIVQLMQRKTHCLCGFDLIRTGIAAGFWVSVDEYGDVEWIV